MSDEDTSSNHQFHDASSSLSVSLEDAEESSTEPSYRYASSSESTIEEDAFMRPEVSEVGAQDSSNFGEDETSDDTYLAESDISMSISLAKSELKKTKVLPSDFTKIMLLGKGAVGKVYLVKHNETGKLYAMKVLSKEEMIARNKVSGVLTEREILSTSDHPSIVTLYYCFQSTTKLIFIMEYCAGGEFYKVIQRQPSKCLTEEQTRFYAGEVLLALEYLHNSGYVYRDLKPENILMDSNGHVKLTDFDLSKAVKTDTENQFSLQDFLTTSFVGTEEYIAPEILRGTGYGSSVDWWTFGILMFEMLYGRTPFRGQNRDRTFKNIKSGNLKLNSKTKRGALSRECKDLLKKLLHKDVRKRLGAGSRDALEIKKHPFFKGLKFDQLHNLEPPIKPRLNGENDFRYFRKFGPDKGDLIPSEIGDEIESQNLPYDHPWKDFKRVTNEPDKHKGNLNTDEPIDAKKTKKSKKKKKKLNSSSSSSSSVNIYKAFLKFIGVRKSSSSSSSSSMEKKKKKKTLKKGKDQTLKKEDDSSTIQYSASDSEQAHLSHLSEIEDNPIEHEYIPRTRNKTKRRKPPPKIRSNSSSSDSHINLRTVNSRKKKKNNSSGSSSHQKKSTKRTMEDSQRRMQPKQQDSSSSSSSVVELRRKRKEKAKIDKDLTNRRKKGKSKLRHASSGSSSDENNMLNRTNGRKKGKSASSEEERGDIKNSKRRHRKESTIKNEKKLRSGTPKKKRHKEGQDDIRKKSSKQKINSGSSSDSKRKKSKKVHNARSSSSSIDVREMRV